MKESCLLCTGRVLNPYVWVTDRPFLKLCKLAVPGMLLCGFQGSRYRPQTAEERKGQEGKEPVSVWAQCFLISHCNKTLQTWCLTQQKCIVTAWCRGESPKSRCQQDVFLLKVTGKDLFPGFLRVICWQSLAFLAIDTQHQPLPSSSHGFSLMRICPTFPLFTRTSDVLDQGPAQWA